MSWTTVTADHVMEEFTPAERSALTRIQDATDNLSAILTRVVSMARGNIAAGRNTLGDAGTVPPQLTLDIIAIARWRWLTAIPQARAMQTEERKQAYTDAMRRLDEIAKGELAVEAPDDSATSDPGGSWGSQERILMRTDDPTDDNE